MPAPALLPWLLLTRSVLCVACSVHAECPRFLFTGLLLQTNPDGVTNDRMLFSVVVGVLTTSSARHASHMLCHTSRPLNPRRVALLLLTPYPPPRPSASA